jgi:hypothetical protein
LLLFAPTSHADDEAGLLVDGWRISLGPAYEGFSQAHNALQIRADTGFEDVAEDWRDGDSNGSGWGLQFEATKGTSSAIVRFMRADTDFEVMHDASSFTKLDSNRSDIEILWREVTGNNDNGIWGWQAGIHWIGNDHGVEIREEGRYTFEPEEGDPRPPSRNVVEFRDDINWGMVTAGYHGQWRPFDGKYFRAHGGLNAMLGEVQGVARRGNDINPADGYIQNEYIDDFSIAYGANIAGGIEVTVYKRLELGVEYRRQWLYSFEATNTGLVVFPDNDDALFIDVTHSVYAYLGFVF